MNLKNCPRYCRGKCLSAEKFLFLGRTVGPEITVLSSTAGNQFTIGSIQSSTHVVYYLKKNIYMELLAW